MVAWYVEVPNLVGFAYVNRALPPLYFMSIYTFYYVDLMVVLSLLLF